MNNTKKIAPGLVLVLMSAAIFASVYIQYQLPPIAGSLIGTFNLTPTQFSSIFSAPMIPTIALSIVGGILVDRIGVKPVVMLSGFITAAGAILRIWSGSYVMLMLSMLMAGMLPTILNGNSGKIFSLYYAPEKLSGVIGIFCACSTIAMAVGTATTAMLPDIKTTFTLSAVLASIVVIALLLLWKVPVAPAGEQQGTPQVSIMACIKVALGSKSIWAIGLVLGMNMAAVMVLNTFLPTALTAQGMSEVDAGFYSSVIMIGNAVAAVIVPVIAKKTGKSKLIISLSTLVGAAGVAFTWRLSAGPVLVIALFVTGLAMSGLMPLLMSMPVQLKEIGPAYAGTAGGVVVTLQMLCAVIIPTYILTPLVGNNLPLFFTIGGGLLVLGFLCSLLLPDLDKK